jgi:hypothetical protein
MPKIMEPERCQTGHLYGPVKGASQVAIIVGKETVSGA